MKKRIIISSIAVVLVAVIIALTFAFCNNQNPDIDTSSKKPSSSKPASTEASDDKKDETSSDSSSNVSSLPTFNIGDINWDDYPESSGGDYEAEIPVFKIEDMLDGDETTYWSPYSTESSSVEFSLGKEATFNTVEFIEHRTYITDYILEAKQSGQWVQIYRQDEMGDRVGVLDKTFTAKDFRLTVTMSDERGGIAEIDFKLCDGFILPEQYANLGYHTASRIDKVRANNFDELRGLTDVILFDFASFDKDGNVVWDYLGGGYNEEFLVDMIEETEQALNGQKIRYWFGFQYFTKRNPDVDTADVLATEESRVKLSDAMVELCEKYGFYGIDIDYEYPHNLTQNPEKAWSNYDEFLKILGTKLHAKGYKLSLAMAPSQVRLSSETIKLIDKVNVMSYDIIDSRGRHASYALLDRCVVYFTDLGFDESKLVMGMPFYTKTTTNDGGQAWSWVLNRWRGAIKPWVNWAYTNKYQFYFNGPYMVRDKVFYTMNNGLGGVFNWCMGSDVPDSEGRSLSLTVEETIKRFSK